MPTRGHASAISDTTRQKISRSMYWLQHCATSDVLGVCEEAIDMPYIGGVYSKLCVATPWLCLVLRMLELAPPDELVMKMIKQDIHKYLRVLGLVYKRFIVRTTSERQECVALLHEIMNEDYRKIRVRSISGEFELKHVDEVCEDLIRQSEFIGIPLPAIR